MRRPPFDAELEPELKALTEEIPSTITQEMIPALRAMADSAPALETIMVRGFSRRDVTIVGHDGGEIVVSVLAKKGRAGAGPGIFYVHGGGMITGERFGGIDIVLGWLEAVNGVCVSVEYRLAPEFPDPYPIEDCYLGLLWTSEHALELDIDLDRLIVAGRSAGGGLAAGLALLARDRRGPALAGQLLMCPMLDDRDATVSSRQIDGVGTWDRGSNVTGWRALLGDRRATGDVSIYAAPGRATDLSRLPPAYVDCGSAEVFRDEDVAYATGLWAAGVQAELHVWDGGFHGFDRYLPNAVVSRACRAARDTWVARILT
ncbi:alpha/beta hydrolase [Agreia sp.]|uniref:alpha/beta hydrolase n=1 Tax=Agreia sp. TaxID=1872416 RepID=UPI0035BBE57E